MERKDADTSETAKDPRVYLAAERTFLAWIRTGLAMMGFGFVIARFGLLLHEIRTAPIVQPIAPFGISSQLGIVLVLIGVACILISAIGYVMSVRRLARGEILNRPSWLAVGLALALAVIGLIVSSRLMWIT